MRNLRLLDEFFCHKVSFVCDLTDLFSNVSVIRCLSIDKINWFKYQLCRGLFYYMQPHTWYYYIIGTIQAEDLVQVFSLHYSVRYYWVNKLNIVINSVSEYGNMSETPKSRSPVSTISYWNPSIFRTFVFWIDWKAVL